MKTKTFKRLAAAVAAITMMCAVPMMSGVQNVYADYTITINQDTKDAAQNITTHVYNAYQVFAGDLSGSKLSNIIWGSGVDTTKSIDSKTLLDAVKSIKLADDTTPFSGCTSAAEVAKVLSDKGNDSEIAKAFADVVSDYKSSTSTASGSINAGKYTISVSAAGYYLVEDSSNPTNSSMTRAILKVTGDNTAITPKMDYPELKKEVKNGNSWDSANTGTVGKKVEYKLTSAVPSKIGDYNKYFFIVNDTLSAGLDLDYESNMSARNAIPGDDSKFKVTVGGTTLTDITDFSSGADNIDYDYYSDQSNTDPAYYVVKDGQSFKLVFMNFKQYSAGDAITIEYSATLNSSASISTQGTLANTNTASLKYSSDPNYNYHGTPGAQNDDNNTPQDETQERPDEPDPTSYDPTPNDPNNNDTLPAEPTSDTPDQTVVTYTAQLKILKLDGAAQNQNTPLSGAGFTVYDESGSNVILGSVTSDTNGLLTFKGLGEGKYILKETTTPAGYNTAPDYKFEIKANPINATSCTWVKDTNCDAIFEVDNTLTNQGGFKANIVNNAGTTLPSTGGIGTTIFYVSGGALILGAGIVLVTKKRMSLKDDK